MKLKIILAAWIMIATSFVAQADEEKVVNVYSAQKEHLIRPFFDAFTKETGIQVNFVTGQEDALITRLEDEGKDSPADVLMMADVGNLYKAQSKGLLAPVKSDVLKKQIPSYLQDKDGYWFGFATRARIIAYAKDRVKPDEIKTYDDLTDPKWKGRVLIRTSLNMYNQSLLSSFIAHNGEEKALAWAKGMVANFARPPEGGDRDQLRALAAGVGDVAVSNTYYFGLLENSDDPKDRELAKKVGIIFPNQATTGTHINIRGGGMTASAKHKENAKKLLEFMASDEAQHKFAEINYEYPAKSGIPLSDTVKAWGTFKADTLPLDELGKHQAQAVKLFDHANWP